VGFYNSAQNGGAWKIPGREKYELHLLFASDLVYIGDSSCLRLEVI
jgi:hypothetical protein